MSLTNSRGALTHKQERFCQLLAIGKERMAAFVEAGFNENSLNLMKTLRNPLVVHRIQELALANQGRAAAKLEAEERLINEKTAQGEYTRDWILLQAKQVFDDARGAARYKEALTSLEFMAELLGYTGRGNVRNKTSNRSSRNDGLPDDSDTADQTTYNLSFINQFVEQLNDGSGNGAEDGKEVRARKGKDVIDVDPIDSEGDTT